MQGLPQSWGVEDLLSPSSLTHPQRQQTCSHSQLLWVFCLGNLRPRACDVLRGWGISECYVDAQPPGKAPSQTEILGVQIFPLGKIPWSHMHMRVTKASVC